MVKVAQFLTLLLVLSVRTYGQDKFDYRIDNAVSAIVIYKLGYDSVAKSATLIGTNIYLGGRYYPLANKGRSIQSLEMIEQKDSTLLVKSKKIISILDLFPAANLIDFTNCNLFADSMIWNSNASYTYGGQQYERDEPAAGKNALYFYISFRFTGDLLFVYEGSKKPYYMHEWACPQSYDYTSGSSDPTVFLLKLRGTKKLTKREQRKLGLDRIEKFGYAFYYCD